MTRYFSLFLVALMLAAAGGGPVAAINLVWDDAGNDPDKNWSNNGNWNPDNLPDSTDDLFIGVDAVGANVANAANDVTIVDQNFTVNSITLGNGADVVNSTNGGTTTTEIQVDTSVTVGNGTGTSIITLYDAPAGLQSLDANTMTIGLGGQVTLDSDNALGDLAIMEIDAGLLHIQSGGTIFGNGVIELDDSLAAATTLLDVDGTLTAGAVGILLNPPATTLQITAVNANARVDLDGTSGLGTVNVNRNATLNIDVAIGDDAVVDEFDGTMNLQAGATLDIAGAWNFSGTMDVNTPGIFVGTAGAAAHLAGGAITMTSGTITLGDGLDSLTLDAVLTGTGGVINNSGTIIVNSVSTIGAGTDFNMLGGESKLTVNGTLNVDTPDFNLDGTEAAGNVTTINAGGILDLDLGVGADLSYGHTINMNGGELDVTSSAATAWSLNSGGTINAAGGATSTINSAGETFQIAGDINVTANSTLDVNSVSEYSSTANVVIDAGSTLNHDGATTYSGGSYTGGGILRKGAATIAAATAFNVAQVDLDDSSTTLNADLTINANTVEPDGDGADSSITISDTAQLTININGGGHWTLDPGGAITYNGNAAADSYLAGSDLAMNGTMNHTGDGRLDARVDIGSSGVVNINTAAEPLRLSGGNNTTNPNTISGGTINGPGILGADTLTALHGFGTIGADIDFDVSANLKADNGILSLTVGTAIIDVNEIGTADADGILAVGSPWNTNVTGDVRLNGGEVRGATITNDGATGINGFGLLSAPVNNNTRIDAEGGVLIVQTPGNNNDWDGAGNTGDLNAINGNLEIRDNATFLFNGAALANNASQVFANGFELEFDPASTLTLNGGRYRSTNATDFGGTMTVGAGAAEIAIGGTARFENTSSTTIAGTLSVNNPVTQIDAGATFAGGGTLLNPAGGNNLRLQDGADVDVLVQNQGTLLIGAGSAAQATGLDYQQDATGLWTVDLNGLALNQFDRFTLTGAAQLAGTLGINLGGGYVPALGDAFNILSVTGGATGEFASLLQPIGMPAGLLFEAVYLPTFVQLVVVESLAGDYNENGVVDAADYAVWRDNLGAAAGTLPNDVDGGVIGQPQYDTWKANFGMTSGPGAGALSLASVPEPTALMMLLIGCVAAGFARECRRMS